MWLLHISLQYKLNVLEGQGKVGEFWGEWYCTWQPWGPVWVCLGVKKEVQWENIYSTYEWNTCTEKKGNRNWDMEKVVYTDTGVWTSEIQVLKNLLMKHFYSETRIQKTYTVDLQWLELWWLVYHGCFEHAPGSLGKNLTTAGLQLFKISHFGDFYYALKGIINCSFSVWTNLFKL